MKPNLSWFSRYPAPLRIGVFLLTLGILWVPLAAPFYIFLSDQNLITILTLIILYTLFVLLLQFFWGRWVYQRPDLLRCYGLEISRRNGLELLSGLAIGLISLFLLFTTEGLLGWIVWQPGTMALPRLVAEGLLMSLALGCAEELLFRGWLLTELQRDYKSGVAILINAGIFAAVHFLRPLDQLIRMLPAFPSLFLLGWTLGWAKGSRGSRYGREQWGRLGLPIGLHAGLVWGYYIVNVGNLVRYTDQVPVWITGIDRNPLAGLAGFLFLSLLAGGVWKFTQTQSGRSLR